jgi:hypothetical protein
LRDIFGGDFGGRFARVLHWLARVLCGFVRMLLSA